LELGLSEHPLEGSTAVAELAERIGKGLEKTKVFRILSTPPEEIQELRRCDPIPR
jgi:hypothetical protein